MIIHISACLHENQMYFYSKYSDKEMIFFPLIFSLQR